MMFLFALCVIILGSIIGVLISFVILCKLGAIPTAPLPKWLHPWKEKDEE